MQSAFALDATPLIPLPILIGLGIIALIMIGYALWARMPGSGWRGAVLAVCWLALLNPTLIDEQRESLPDVAVMVVDQTASQKIGDRPQQTAAAAEKLRAAIETRPGVELRQVTVESDRKTDGTHLMGALEAALSDVPPERIAGAILITDGQIHDPPADPATIGYAGPVHTLVSGARDGRDRRLIIERAPSYAIVDDRFTISIMVSDPTSTANSAQVTLRSPGRQPYRTFVRIGESSTLEFATRHAGLSALEIEVEPGEHELTLDNNRTTLVVNGIRDRLRVMLVSGEPSNGLRTWRNLLKADPSVDLVHFTILRPPNKQDLTPVRELSLIPFPTTELFAANLDEFDLIIFDRYHRRGILPMMYLGNVVEYVMRGGAVLDTAGPAFASPLSLATTPLGNILPGRPTQRIIEHGFKPRVTDDGFRHPVTTDLSGSGGPPINGQPVEPTWGRWFRHIEADVTHGTTLMRGAEDLPLLVLDRIGDGRVAQIFSDQSWLWARGYDGGGPQSDLLRRLVHWLMKEPDLEEEALVADTTDAGIRITRRSLGAADGEAQITAPDGTTSTAQLVEQSSGRARTTIPADQPGVYRIAQDEHVAVAVVGSANPLELSDVRSTADIVAPIAEATGGSVKWLIDDDPPRVRWIAPGRAAAGRDWIGFRENRQYVVTGLSQVPVLPAVLLLVLLLGGLMVVWYVEGR